MSFERRLFNFEMHVSERQLPARYANDMFERKLGDFERVTAPNLWNDELITYGVKDLNEYLDTIKVVAGSKRDDIWSKFAKIFAFYGNENIENSRVMVLNQMVL